MSSYSTRFTFTYNRIQPATLREASLYWFLRCRAVSRCVIQYLWCDIITTPIQHQWKKRNRQLHFIGLQLANVNTTIFILYKLNARSSSQSIWFYSLLGIRCDYGTWGKIGCSRKRSLSCRLNVLVERRRRERRNWESSVRQSCARMILGSYTTISP